MLVLRGGSELRLQGATVTDTNGLQRLGVMIDANSEKLLAKAASLDEASRVATEVFVRLVSEQVKALQGIVTGVGSAEILGPVGIVQQGEEMVQSEGLLGIFLFFAAWHRDL